MKCEFCDKECKNKNSYTNHKIRCKYNPERIESYNGFINFNKSEEAKQLHKEIADRRRGTTNEQFFGEEKAKIMSEKIKIGNIGRFHTEETKKSISLTMMGNRNGKHRGNRQSKYKDIRMDSSWEVKVAEYLDLNNFIWTYNEQGYVLSTGNYIYPDFHIWNSIGDLEKIIEVKGYFRKANKEKYELFLKEYPNLVVELWNKDKLKELEILI